MSAPPAGAKASPRGAMDGQKNGSPAMFAGITSHAGALVTATVVLAGTALWAPAQ